MLLKDLISDFLSQPLPTKKKQKKKQQQQQQQQQQNKQNKTYKHFYSEQEIASTVQTEENFSKAKEEAQEKWFLVS